MSSAGEKAKAMCGKPFVRENRFISHHRLLNMWSQWVSLIWWGVFCRQGNNHRGLAWPSMAPKLSRKHPLLDNIGCLEYLSLGFCSPGKWAYPARKLCSNQKWSWVNPEFCQCPWTSPIHWSSLEHTQCMLTATSSGHSLASRVTSPQKTIAWCSGAQLIQPHRFLDLWGVLQHGWHNPMDQIWLVDHISVTPGLSTALRREICVLGSLELIQTHSPGECPHQQDIDQSG